jgi:hypothetical protein
MFDRRDHWCGTLQFRHSRCQLEADCFHLLFLDHHTPWRRIDLWVAHGYGSEHTSLLVLLARYDREPGQLISMLYCGP